MKIRRGTFGALTSFSYSVDVFQARGVAFAAPLACLLEGLLSDWPVFPWAKMIFGGIFGAILGSFANVCIYRVPRGRSVALPRSRCPRCHGSILWFQNIPVLSYILLGGECAHCQKSISGRYVVIEVLMAGIMGLLFYRSLEGASLVLGVSLSFFLVVISVIDLDWKIIPDFFSLGLLGVGLVVSPLNSLLGGEGATRVLSSTVGCLVGFGSAWLLAVAGRRFFRREALGGGDVKLLAGLGAFLGWPGVFTSWFLASILGTLFFVFLKARKKMDWGAYLPFGPFLAAGAWAHWVWPDFFLRCWGF
jgi:leader peptidase (prepilin peptidase)/N-methyltransferase